MAADWMYEVTTKVVAVEFAGTVTVEGTVATALLLLESAITAPPEGAGPLRVTVAVEVAPPVTVVGFNATEIAEGGFTVNVLEAPPLYVAEMSDELGAATAIDVTTKVAVMEFAATVTVAGTVAAVLLELESATTAPPDGARPLSVTVAVEFVPPVTAPGLSAREATAGGFTVRLAAKLLPLRVVIVTAVDPLTG